MADNPQALMAVSLGLILSCAIIITLFIVYVHTMPGKIARKRGNPQAEAIEILSLLGLLMFPLWMAALVWAYMRPFTIPMKMVEDDLKKNAIAPEPPTEATAEENEVP